MALSLFERIGGGPAVDAAVDLFYRKVLSDPLINHFFEDTNMDAQREKQKKFLTMVFGGPNEYKGKDLRTAHAGLVEKGLDETHFTAVAKHLQSTLDELGVAPEVSAEVMTVAGGTLNDVLNR